MNVVVPTGEERLNLIAPFREILSPGDVLEIIEPLDPDNLLHVGNGVFEARWLDEAAGAEEIAKLCNEHRRRVVVVSERPERPEGLPRAISIRFCIIALPMQETEVVQ